jgi:hypothetical protein
MRRCGGVIGISFSQGCSGALCDGIIAAPVMSGIRTAMLIEMQPFLASARWGDTKRTYRAVVVGTSRHDKQLRPNKNN